MQTVAGEPQRMIKTGPVAASPGFSVLEAIIAIAILAIAFLPLLALQEQMARNTLSMERNQKVMAVKRSALAYVRAINPMRDPRGETNLGAAIMRWDAIPVSEERPVVKPGGVKGRFVVRLYDVEVTLEFEDLRAQTFSVQIMGWRATQSMLSGL